MTDELKNVDDVQERIKRKGLGFSRIVFSLQPYDSAHMILRFFRIILPQMSMLRSACRHQQIQTKPEMAGLLVLARVHPSACFSVPSSVRLGEIIVVTHSLLHRGL
jgi:hypothetical protein